MSGNVIPFLLLYVSQAGFELLFSHLSLLSAGIGMYYHVQLYFLKLKKSFIQYFPSFIVSLAI